MTAWAKVENGKVVALDYSGNAEGLSNWFPLDDEPPAFDPATHGAGIPTYEAKGDRVVAVYAVAPLPAPDPDPDDELAGAISAVDTSKVTDPATKAALDALKAALLGNGNPAAVSGRPTR